MGTLTPLNVPPHAALPLQLVQLAKALALSGETVGVLFDPLGPELGDAHTVIFVVDRRY